MDRMATYLMHDSRSDNRTLQRNLRVLLAEAKRNEDKLQRLQSLELLLLGAGSLSELVRMLLHHYREDFGLDAVSLLLSDPHYEIRRILEDEGVDLATLPQLMFSEDVMAMQAQLAVSTTPRLGPYKQDLHGDLFRHATAPVQSVACLPLARQGCVLGCLNLGSADARRYLDGTGTDLLQRLAAIIAICLENTLNLERLKRTGLTDALTSLNNRRFFDQRILEEVERARRHAQPLSCLFIDIDHFKTINDDHGHPVGDKVLRQVASQLETMMRRSDVLARFGGEEFAVLLGNTQTDSAEETAERLRYAIESTAMATDTGVLKLTVSIGVATTCPAETKAGIEQQAESLLTAADEALLEAKRSGRNRVVTAPPIIQAGG